MPNRKKVERSANYSYYSDLLCNIVWVLYFFNA